MTSKIALSDCTHIDVAPLYWAPETEEEWLAATVAYNLGDGNVAVRRGGCQASFYAQKQSDVDSLSLGLCQAGLITTPPRVCFKKGRTPEFDTYQTYLFGDNARSLLTSGAVAGKKVEQTFCVPGWVRAGTPGVKRAFLAALWGAEGSTPSLNINHAGQAMKLPRMPVLSMSKRIGVDGSGFFVSLVEMLAELDVRSSVRSAKVGRNTTYYLYVASGIENIEAFFSNVGFLFCEEKSFNAWLWVKYLKAYLYSRKTIADKISHLRDEGISWDDVAKTMGMNKGKVYNIHQRGVSRSSWDFPGFADWVNARYNKTTNLLKLEVKAKIDSGVKPVFNVRVDSHDHSYLVDVGINNFNSFETMSGRVYYAFNRADHVGDYPFDPNVHIIVGQDFNVDPMCSVILQWKPKLNELWAVDEIFLRQSNTVEVVDELERRYWRLFPRQVALFPDASGGNRSSARGESDLQVFRERGVNRIHNKPKNPMVSDRINAVNAMLKNADGTIRLRVDKRCKNLIDSLEQVIYKPGTRDIDKKRNNDHMGDAIGYPIEALFPAIRVPLIGASR